MNIMKSEILLFITLFGITTWAVAQTSSAGAAAPMNPNSPLNPNNPNNPNSRNNPNNGFGHGGSQTVSDQATQSLMDLAQIRLSRTNFGEQTTKRK
jgi:hypothetical protein